MAKKLYEETDIQAIANSIRGKCGTTCGYKVCDMAEAIESIEAGGGNTGSGVDTGIIDRTISGSYSNADVNKVGEYAFYHCSNLTAIDLPAATEIGESAFNSCENLASINIPSVTSIKWNAFEYTNLGSIKLPNVTHIENNAFYSAGLTSVDFSKVVDIQAQAFRNNGRLTTLILRGSAIGPWNSGYDYGHDILRETGIQMGQGYIYVPRSLVTAYQEHQFWGTYANQIRALEDYTVNGTTTGALDPTKI